MLRYLDKLGTGGAQHDKKFYLLWVERIALAASVIFFIWFTVFHILEKEKYWGAGKTDFAIFYAVGEIVAKRADVPASDIYKRKILLSVIKSHFKQKGGTVFVYPPPSAVIITPYAFLPFKWATYAWALTSALCFLAAYLLIIGILLQDRITRFRYSILLFGFSFADTIHGIFFSGQINALILAFMICGIVALAKKKEILSGFLLGTVTVIKVFPAIFFPYLLIKKKWKAAISFAVTGIGWFLISLPIFGIDGMMRFFTVKLPKLLKGEVGYAPESTSLIGSLNNSVFNGNWDFLGIKHKIVLHSLETIFPFIALALIILLFYLLWKKRTITTGPQLILDYSLLILTVLLVSKAIHLAFHIWIIPAAFYWIRRLTKKSTWIDWVLGVLAIVTLICTQFWKIFPFQPHDTILGWKPATACMVILLILTILLYTSPFRKRFFDKLNKEVDK